MAEEQNSVFYNHNTQLGFRYAPTVGIAVGHDIRCRRIADEWQGQHIPIGLVLVVTIKHIKQD